MKALLTCLFIFFSFSCVSQVRTDSILCQQKKIVVENDIKYGYKGFRYPKCSYNLNDTLIPYIDSLFEIQPNGYQKYVGINRIFIDTSSSIWVRKFISKEGKTLDNFNGIKGDYDYFFPKLKNLQLSISYYNEDTSISIISVAFVKTINYHFYPEFKILRMEFGNKGAFLNNSSGKIILDCDSIGQLEIKFNEFNLLSSMYFYSKSNLRKSYYYEFYSNLRCKLYGEIQNLTRLGEWKEFYSNGNIKSICIYSEVNQNQKIIKYDIPICKYYSENGNLISDSENKK